MDGVAHGLFTRNALLGGDGSLKSSDALLHGQGVGGDGYGCSGGGSELGDNEDFSAWPYYYYYIEVRLEPQSLGSVISSPLGP